jgi:hypothetical protein
MPQIYDFPSEGRRAEDFFALKNPTASAGFEPANLGAKGQHATLRPPKPLLHVIYFQNVNGHSVHVCFIYIYIYKTSVALVTHCSSAEWGQFSNFPNAFAHPGTKKAFSQFLRLKT